MLKPTLDKRKIMQMETSNEESGSTFPQLNEYCLIRVFENLPIADKVALERVNKLWQRSSKRSWRKIQVLKFDPKFLGLKPVASTHKFAEIDAMGVRKIFSRCGKYLKKLDVSYFDFDSTSYFIAKYCPNIQSITCDAISTSGIRRLTRNCNNISEINVLNFLWKVSEDALGNFFLANQKLRIFKIQYYRGSGNSLFNLPLELMDSIEIGEIDIYNIDNIIDLILNCENLKSLECNIVHPDMISALEDTCTNLTELKLKSNSAPFDDRIDYLDDYLSPIFSKNKNLKLLQLESFKGLTGECLRFLNGETIEKIILRDIEWIHSEYLADALPYFQKLNTLEFDELFEVDIIYGITGSLTLCPNLKQLTLKEGESDSNENLMESLSFLHNLEKLSIIRFQDVEYSETFFSYIATNLKDLEYLDLSNTKFNLKGISDKDIKFISILPKLEVLKTRNLPITGSCLKNFSNLKLLDCRGCKNLFNNNLMRFLRRAKNLQLLDLEGCNKITNSVIEFAIKITKNRTNNLILEIGISQTKIDIDKIEGNSSLLYLRGESANDSMSESEDESEDELEEKSEDESEFELEDEPEDYELDYELDV